MGSELRRDVKLPSKLSDIRDPRSANWSIADGDFRRSQERERLVRHVRIGNLREQGAGVRPHQSQHGVRRGNVREEGMSVVGDVVLYPAKVTPCGGACRHDHVLLFAYTSDRKVGLESAPLVQHSGVHDPARIDGHLTRENPLSHRLCIPSLQEELRKRGLVEQSHRFTDGPMLLVQSTGTNSAVRTSSGTQVLRRVAHTSWAVPIR